VRTPRSSSLLNNVLMNRLPVRNPHELVILTDPVREAWGRGMQNGERTPWPAIRSSWRSAANTAFDALMASSSSLQRTDARVDGGELRPLAIRLYRLNYFSTLGISPALGQTFDAASRAGGCAPRPVAVLSDEYIGSGGLGGRADVIGRAIAFRGGIVSVVGVAPSVLSGRDGGRAARPLDAAWPCRQPSCPGDDWLE
jgi:hypothetical protein